MGEGETHDCVCGTAALAIVFNYTPAGLIRRLASVLAATLRSPGTFLGGINAVLCPKQDRHIIFDGIGRVCTMFKALIFLKLHGP